MQNTAGNLHFGGVFRWAEEGGYFAGREVSWAAKGRVEILKNRTVRRTLIANDPLAPATCGSLCYFMPLSIFVCLL